MGHKASKFNHSKDYNKDHKKWYKNDLEEIGEEICIFEEELK